MNSRRHSPHHECRDDDGQHQHDNPNHHAHYDGHAWRTAAGTGGIGWRNKQATKVKAELEGLIKLLGGLNTD